jgi:surfactin synthase thioesterase subunit
MSISDPVTSKDPLEFLQKYSSQDDQTITLSNSMILTEKDHNNDERYLFLREVFSKSFAVEDLSKGHFFLDQGELDEESAEVLIPEFL